MYMCRTRSQFLGYRRESEHEKYNIHIIVLSKWYKNFHWWNYIHISIASNFFHPSHKYIYVYIFYSLYLLLFPPSLYINIHILFCGARPIEFAIKGLVDSLVYVHEWCFFKTGGHARTKSLSFYNLTHYYFCSLFLMPCTFLPCSNYGILMVIIPPCIEYSEYILSMDFQLAGRRRH